MSKEINVLICHLMIHLYPSLLRKKNWIENLCQKDITTLIEIGLKRQKSVINCPGLLTDIIVLFMENIFFFLNARQSSANYHKN